MTPADAEPEVPGPVVTSGCHTAATPRRTGSIRVVSWNIQFGVRVEAAARALTEHDRLAGADIVLLQEMDEIGTARLADMLSMHHVYAAPGIHRQSGRNFGNAVLSPWALGEPVVIPLPFTASVNGQERLLLRTEAEVDGRTIDVGSVHTEIPSMRSSRRLAQFDVIAGAWASDRARPMIVGGDFNTVTDRGIRAVSERMSGVGAVRVSADAGPTLRRSGREFTLDHLFARGLQAVASGVVTGSDASDHRPIWAVLRGTPADRLGHGRA